jgi:hypothetical protein
MTTLTLERDVHFQRIGHGYHHALRPVPAPRPAPPGRVPRIIRLLALALRCEQRLREGHPGIPPIDSPRLHVGCGWPARARTL